MAAVSLFHSLNMATVTSREKHSMQPFPFSFAQVRAHTIKTGVVKCIFVFAGHRPCLGARGGPLNEYQWFTYDEVCNDTSSLQLMNLGPRFCMITLIVWNGSNHITLIRPEKISVLVMI